MIEFYPPSLSFTLSDYMELTDLWESCSSCVGFCISLGDQLFSSGIEEIDNLIRPTLLAKAGSEVISRVIPSYSILYWYCSRVSNYMQPCRYAAYLLISLNDFAYGTLIC